MENFVFSEAGHRYFDYERLKNTLLPARRAKREGIPGTELSAKPARMQPPTLNQNQREYFIIRMNRINAGLTLIR